MTAIYYKTLLRIEDQNTVDAIKKISKLNKRSMNAQILFWIENGILVDSKVPE